jgi:hypothetical protein
LTSYNPFACCGDHCVFYDATQDEPCWGDVKMIADGVELATGDTWRVHVCQGHQPTISGGDYLVEPPPDEIVLSTSTGYCRA